MYVELGIISWRILYLNANVQIGVLDLHSVLTIITVVKRIRYSFLKIGRVIIHLNEQHFENKDKSEFECEFNIGMFCHDQDGFIFVLIEH